MTLDGRVIHATSSLVDVAPHCRISRFSDIGATCVPGRDNATLCDEVGPVNAVHLRNGKGKTAFGEPC